MTRSFPGIGSLKGVVKFAEGEYPEKPKSDIVTYKPLKDSDKDKEKTDKPESDKE